MRICVSFNTSSGFSPACRFALQPGEAGYDPNAFIELWTPADAGYQAANPYGNTQARYFIPLPEVRGRPSAPIDRLPS
ncbi:MAG: hypothetical protein J0L84_04465 [Verrucomicrobia bacterium]|nr:hypothetical protein [Verrucomicrobiota bacterium]